MSMLVTLLVTVIVGGLIWYLVRMLPLPAPIKQVAEIICILIEILYLIGVLTGYGGLAPIRVS